MFKPCAHSARGFVAPPPCLQNPTTHYYGGNPGNVISGNPNTWIDKGATKSIYDPCPYGYRVPINGSWAGFTGNKWTEGDIKGGAVWRSTWWPAAGVHNSNNAAIGGVAGTGRYWSSPYSSYNGYTLYFYCGGAVDSSNSTYRSSGFSLRCVQE